MSLLHSFLRKIDATITIGRNDLVLLRQHAPPAENIRDYRLTNPYGKSGDPLGGLLNQRKRTVSNVPVAVGFYKKTGYARDKLGYFEDE